MLWFANGGGQTTSVIYLVSLRIALVGKQQHLTIKCTFQNCCTFSLSYHCLWNIFLFLLLPGVTYFDSRFLLLGFRVTSDIGLRLELGKGWEGCVGVVGWWGGGSTPLTSLGPSHEYLIELGSVGVWQLDKFFEPLVNVSWCSILLVEAIWRCALPPTMFSRVFFKSVKGSYKVGKYTLYPDC